MKSVEQLLKLSENPFYKMTAAEEKVLDDFLLKKKEEDSKASRKKSEKHSEGNTPVRVRNIVERTVPEVKDSGE